MSGDPPCRADLQILQLRTARSTASVTTRHASFLKSRATHAPDLESTCLVGAYTRKNVSQIVGPNEEEVRGRLL